MAQPVAPPQNFLAGMVILVFQPQNVAQITNQEWDDYRLEVQNWEQNELGLLAAENPPAHQAAFPAKPAHWDANPQNATTRHQASMYIVQWMYGARAQTMVVTNQNALNVAQAALAAAQAGVVAAQQAVQNPPNLQQLVQALQALVPAQPQAPPPAPLRVKVATPKPFTGNPSQVRAFLRDCETYFAFNPMTPEQRALFALQLFEGDTVHWKTT